MNKINKISKILESNKDDPDKNSKKINLSIPYEKLSDSILDK